MALSCVRPPIIVMGMARSGTTLLADLLRRLGLFIGHKRIVVDQEATYFVSVNDMLLKRVHGYWDNPAPMRAFLKQDSAISSTVRCMEEDIRSLRIVSFLGWQQYLRYRTIEAFDKPWGWKDPRNVFTLPLWLRLFPEAKIICIVRNGVDVAESLLNLERKVVARRQVRNARVLRRLSLRSHLERNGFKGAARCLDLSGGFSLWEEYIAHADGLLLAISNSRKVLRYEDFLANPQEKLEELVQFCDLNTASQKTIAEAVMRIDRNRRCAFLSDSRLTSFYFQVKTSPWMVRHDYGHLA